MACGRFSSFSPSRVVITGLGLVTPLGIGANAAWQQLISGCTAVRQLNETDLPEGHGRMLQHLPSQVAALVPRGELKKAMQVITKL
jgi:3-oxoacyl-[acyl-carrier-protein] synthase II